MIKKCNIILIASILLAGCSGTSPKLGVEDGRLTPCPATPNCVSSQAAKEDKEHYIEPLVVTGSAPEVKNLILEMLGSLQRTNVVEADDNYIRAEFTSRIFRFVDDVEFYFPDAGDKKTSIQVRSASRLGHSDLGVNRKRIETIRSKLESMSQEKQP